MQSALGRRGRKGTAQKLAVGSARPDSEARRVTADMCRELLKRPALSDAESERILEHFYSFANVVVDAFIERPRCSSVIPIIGETPLAASNETLTSPIAA